MKPMFLIDSADPVNWRKYHKRGWVSGATTNPLILKREGFGCGHQVYKRLVDQASDLGLEQLHIQAVGAGSREILDSAREIASLWERVVVKVPLSEAGLEAAAILSSEGVRLTLTAAYTAHQMIPALTMNAAFIAPYYGRLAEAGEDATLVVERMRLMRDHAGAKTRILMASLRSVEQVEMLLALGHDTFTLAPAIAEQVGLSAMSQEAAEAFEAAAAG